MKKGKKTNARGQITRQKKGNVAHSEGSVSRLFVQDYGLGPVSRRHNRSYSFRRVVSVVPFLVQMVVKTLEKEIVRFGRHTRCQNS